MLLAKTVETTGIVNNQHQLILDESLPIAETSRVRVIVIVTEEAQTKAASKRDPEKIDALCGSFRNCLSGSDAFAKRKREEIRLERVKWQRK
ncbi:hypothetical protein QUF72_02855 [Desulfobacterales bacterium HSG2]|nr:hypothetical protein [Desulfobacterales bacterium HSG2]